MQILKRKDAKARTVSRKRSNPNIFGLKRVVAVARVFGGGGVAAAARRM
jgi:hypothetical protein